jgi:hypothetical protein
MADVSAIAPHVGTVTIYVAVFPAKLGPLMLCSGIIVTPQSAMKISTITVNLGLIASNITFIVTDVSRVTTNVLPTITVTPIAVLGHHRSDTHDANEHNAK